MSNSLDPLGLADNFVLQIQNLVDGNQVSRNDVEKIDSQVCDIAFDLTIFWSFYGEVKENRVSGGSASHNHFDKNKNKFEEHTNNLLLLSQSDQNQRVQFIEKLYELQGQGLILIDDKQKVRDFPEFSYFETCTKCSGKGKISCSSCWGSGRKNCYSCGGSGRQTATRTVYVGNNQTRTETYTVSCSGCGGSGKRTCGSCGGSGRIKCSTCDGYGYFTNIRLVSMYARATHKIVMETPYYFDETAKFINSVTKIGNFLANRTNCEFLGQIASDSQNEQFTYRSESFLCALNYRVLNKQYFGLAIANPPYPFIKAPIFDDLFADEIAELKKIGYDGKITHKEAFGFFTKYLWQPVLERSLQDIASYRSTKDDNFTTVVMQHCDGYINRDSASYFSNMINNMLDKISPAYSSITWIVGGGIFSLIMFFFAELLCESAIKDIPIFSIIIIIVSFLILCIGFGVVLAILSSIVVFIRRRKIPKQYRQKMRNRMAFANMVVFSLFSTIFGIIFGCATLKLPQFKLTDYFYETVQKLDKNYDFCKKLEPICVFANEIKELNDNNTKQSTHIQPTLTLSKRDKVIFIQQELVKHGYKLKVDGKFGSKTILASQKHLKKKISNIDEIYNELYQQTGKK